ncbi:MAG TPA: hypothetical protein DIV80_06525, partial [Synergistaceae bacterium]|nr:hypothetical protein [Synergistaceae bacterium]
MLPLHFRSGLNLNKRQGRADQALHPSADPAGKMGVVARAPRMTGIMGTEAPCSLHIQHPVDDPFFKKQQQRPVKGDTILPLGES